MTQITDCRMGVQLSLEACHKRQLQRRRWTKPRYATSEQILNPMFLSCCNCKHWLPDEEWEIRSKVNKHSPHAWRALQKRR